ncbi:MAG: hypothetical protein QOE66_1656, partial [Chloroflexota bacterium]|nr:hypothetical protein [Chloroflexota bacterium]
MDTMLILGDGGLGRAVETAARERAGATGATGTTPACAGVRLAGRPATGRHDTSDIAGFGTVIEASRGDAVASNL